MSYGLFDTHAHYTDRRFETEYEGGAESLLRAVFASGVEKIVNVGVDYENSLEVIAQAAKYDGMYAAVGIHPGDCKKCTDIDFEMERLSSLLERNDELKIVAVGEIGFDYYWEPIEKEKQYDYFYRQMELAEKYGLPVLAKIPIDHRLAALCDKGALELMENDYLEKAVEAIENFDAKK